MPSLTYAELAEALRITPASANKLARRKRWPRVPGNDGKARVSVPEEAIVRRDSPPDSPLDVPPVSPQDNPPPSPPDNLIKALEAHVETLKAQLAAAETRIGKQAEDLVAYDAAYAAGLAAERAKVEAERAKAERVIAEFAARDAQRADELEAERARTEQAHADLAGHVETLKGQLAGAEARAGEEAARTSAAIKAFADLADRLDALAAERARPWWRRLAG